MRCLAIARACKEQGASVRFIVSDTTSLSLLTERLNTPDEFGIHCLYSDYRSLYAELPLLLPLLKQEQPFVYKNQPDSSGALSQFPAADYGRPWLFIDSYYAAPAYFAALRECCRVAYLDDLRSFLCDVDLLVNYDTEADCSYYRNASRRLLGPQYTPLRAQFMQPSYTVRPVVKNILLSTGGTDPYGLAQRLLQSIYAPLQADASEGPWEPLRTYDYHILTSRANRRCHALAALAKTNRHIHIHEGVSDMASLMASCDLAVSAGGTTLCELCAVGVPTISYLMADNQRTAVETFANSGLIPCAGDILQPSAILDRILLFLTSMSVDYEARKKSSHSMRAFLDGKGAARIANALLYS